MVFVSEVVLPIEVIPTTRIHLQYAKDNGKQLIHDLDTIDEVRDQTKLRIIAYQQRITKAYNMNIRMIRFQVGYLVLRMSFKNIIWSSDGKFTPKWESPYQIDTEAGKRA